MNFPTWRMTGATAITLTLMGGALAEQPTPVRVRGQIEKVDGNT